MSDTATEHDWRHLPTDGIFNFRDYGGYAARGGRLRRGVLWRSGQHASATAEDLSHVEAIQLQTVIDLRGDSERESYPCARPLGFAAEVLFHPGETSGSRNRAAHEEAVESVRTAADAHAAMVRLYEGMAWRPVLVGTYRLYFDALAEREGASLLHCFAGKDRTGLAAALLHDLLGVHPDDAMADYLLTNQAANRDRRIAAGGNLLRGNHGPQLSDDAIRTLMSVDEAYLTTALDAIRARHGSIEAYAEEVLGVTPDKREALAANLVE